METSKHQMAPLIIKYSYRNNPFMFIRYSSRWYLNAKEIGDYLGIIIGEYLSKDDFKLLKNSIMELYNLNECDLVIHSFRERPELGIILIEDLALHVAGQYDVGLKDWLNDRISEFNFYDIPFDNLPETKSERQSLHTSLILKSNQANLTPYIREMYQSCAAAIID